LVEPAYLVANIRPDRHEKNARAVSLIPTV